VFSSLEISIHGAFRMPLSLQRIIPFLDDYALLSHHLTPSSLKKLILCFTPVDLEQCGKYGGKLDCFSFHFLFAIFDSSLN
jgi:hypothetical protein